jgi:hypothetical protein
MNMKNQSYLIHHYHSMIHIIRLYIIIFLINTFFNLSAACQVEPDTNLTGTRYDLPTVLSQDHPDWLANQIKNEASVKSSLHQLPSNLNDWKVYRDTLKAEIIKRTGALLGQNLPLNLKETGSIRRNGYTVKNILFQTRPGIYATANLYIPDGKGKFPGVVVMMGHSYNGRFYTKYQAVGVSLALQGYVSLCIDPWGSGERTTIHGIFEDHGDENNLGSSVLNIGETLMGMEITDNVRAIDLLCSLPIVDPEKIGATGSSGGGNQTMWLTALDERIKAAVPVVSAGTFEAYMLGSPCICEVLPAGLTFTEEAGIIAMIAPRAVNMINHERDDIPAFLPREMMRSFSIAQPVFKMLAAENNIAYQVFDLPHGYFPEDREVMLGWFNLHLKGVGRGDPLKEPLIDTIPYEQLMTFQPGKRDPSVKTTEEFCIQKGKELRSAFLSEYSFSNELKRNELRNLLGVNEKSYLVCAHAYSELNGWKRLALETSDGRILPVLLQTPENEPGEYVIICNTASMKETPSGLIDKYLRSGTSVALVDLSGIGETTSIQSHINDNNGNLRTLSRSELWLGTTLLGEWEKDLDVLTGYLKSTYKARKVAIDGTREAGLAALFLAAMEGNIDELILRDTPISYLFDSRENIDFYTMAINIPGFLKWGDVSLAAALSGVNITFINSLTMSGRLIPGDRISEFQTEFEQLRKRCMEPGIATFIP